MNEKYLSFIEAAIKKRKPLSFKYVRADGRSFKHNAIYPQQIYEKNNHIYFDAYCHFTSDTRTFRLERVQSLRLAPEQKRKFQKALLWRIIKVGFVMVVVLEILRRCGLIGG